MKNRATQEQRKTLADCGGNWTHDLQIWLSLLNRLIYKAKLEFAMGSKDLNDCDLSVPFQCPMVLSR